MRVAHYLRVSTDGQRERQTIESQREALLRYSHDRGQDVVAVYADDGVTGTHFDRPQLNKLLVDAKAHHFDAVTIWSHDRLSRAPFEDMLIWLGLFKQLGIPLIEASTDSDLTSSSAYGRLETVMKSFLADQERVNLLERLQRGKRHAVEQGSYGGGVVPYGYRLLDGRLAVHEGQAAIVKSVFSWAGTDGLSCTKIADRLNALGHRSQTANDRSRTSSGSWSADQVRRMLRSTTYVGERAWGKRSRGGEPSGVVHCPCPAIVAKAIWLAAQDHLDRLRTWHLPPDPTKYPLSGRIRCDHCGRAFTGITMRGVRRYRCSSIHSRYRSEDRCKTPSVQADWLETQVWQYLSAVIGDPKCLQESVLSSLTDHDAAADTDLLEALSVRDIDLSREADMVAEELGKADDEFSRDALRRRLGRLSDEAKGVAAQRSAAMQAVSQREQASRLALEIEGAVARIRASLAAPTTVQRAEVMRLLVVSVRIRRDAPRATCELRLPATDPSPMQWAARDPESIRQSVLVSATLPAN